MQNIAVDDKKPLAVYLSKGISYLFHPFLIPLYLVLLLFGTGLVPMYVAPALKRYMISVVVINTVLIPAMAIVLLHVFRVIPDYSLSTRHDRMLPLLVVALSYGLCGWLLKDAQMLFLLRRCMFAATGCVVFAMIVTAFWQVSLHMTAIGGATGALAILLYGGFFSLVPLFCSAIIVSGLLGTARLYLGKHNPAQVAVGFFSGFFITIFVLLLSV